MNSEISSSNPVVKAVIEGTAPRPALVAASRGILPLSQVELLEVLVNFATDDDAELKENARQTLSSVDYDELLGSIRSAEIAPKVLGYFARQEELPVAIHEAVLANAAVPPQAVAALARTTTNGGLLELISFNQQLLIQNPEI